MDKKESVNLRVLKRINSDIAELGKNIDDLNNNGIFWHIDEDNMREIFFVITGPEGTPYAYAPFFFKFTFPDNYPLIPPEGKFCTSDGQTRFNPNLYVEGKICLSILGTWSGPSWTPVMTIKTVIISIIGLVMSSEPLRNEPGLESSKKEDIDEYNDVVEFRSMKTAIIAQLNNCQECFKPLYDKIVERFRMDFVKIMAKIDKNLEKFKTPTMVKPRYGACALIDYVSLKNDMIELGRKFGCEIIPEKKVEEPKSEVMPSQKVGETEQITPKMSASNFEVGLEVEYMGNKYVIQMYKNGRKYWKKN